MSRPSGPTPRSARSPEGERVETMRKALGLTQVQAAAWVGVSAPTWRRWVMSYEAPSYSPPPRYMMVLCDVVALADEKKIKEKVKINLDG